LVNIYYHRMLYIGETIMIKIVRYRFGEIVIGNEKYSRDIIVSEDRVIVKNWWRKEGHRLCLDDIKDVLEKYRPKILVVGTGYYGFMKVSNDLKNFLKNNNIELIEAPTGDAIKKFNELVEKGIKVLGAFHLTC